MTRRRLGPRNRREACGRMWLCSNAPGAAIAEPTGQIVLLYQDRLYNAMLRMVGDREEARELAQEAFTRGLVKIQSFRGDASPYTWLFRIAVNLAISQLRKVQKQRVFSLDRPGSGNGKGRRGGEDQASALLDRVARDRTEAPPQRAGAPRTRPGSAGGTGPARRRVPRGARDARHRRV